MLLAVRSCEAERRALILSLGSRSVTHAQPHHTPTGELVKVSRNDVAGFVVVRCCFVAVVYAAVPLSHLNYSTDNVIIVLNSDKTFLRQVFPSACVLQFRCCCFLLLWLVCLSSSTLRCIFGGVRAALFLSRDQMGSVVEISYTRICYISALAIST